MYNQAASGQYNDKVLEKCDGCGRTFNPEALTKHQKMCKGASASAEKPPMPAARPKALMCYICGREYGTASLEIHIKTCKKKWDIEQEKKPKHQRRPCPEAPANFGQIVDGGPITDSKLGSYNEAAFDNYNNKALEKCSGCSRTFNPDALVRHKKMCLKGREEENKSPNLPAMKPKALMCYICGREYGTASLEIHLRTCKKKFETEQSKLPLNKRKPVPEAPKTLDEVKVVG